MWPADVHSSGHSTRAHDSPLTSPLRERIRPRVASRPPVGYGVEVATVFYWATVTLPGFTAQALALSPSRNGLRREVSMMTCKVGRTLAQAAFLGTLAIGSAIAQTPQQGTITGRVTDAATGQPVAAAQVSIVGTQRRYAGARRRANSRFVA